MKLYKISCPSKCGSYFASYLQEVLVFADTPEQAKELALDTYKGDFVNDKFEVDCVCDEIPTEPQIVDARYDSDY